MAKQVEQMLTEDLYLLLQKERFVTIATVDHETKGPNINAISWVYAPDRQTIRFAVDSRSRIVHNIKGNPAIVLNLIGNGSAFAINGNAILKEEKLNDVPLKLSLIEIVVKEVRDVMFYGSKIVEGPTYEKTYDAQAAEKLDSQVMGALQKA
ncbi:MAG: pyridoxamine 5'-phosphate oxidase family protein [Bacillaceae bacterium]|nr:pyridoxamine 5'-phosphate oxidase family protein [Bacillaceae bacterium]